MRIREQCTDGSTGVTGEYKCDCSQVGAALGRWQCDLTWATTADCSGIVGDAGSGPSVDAGRYWIMVQGDGVPYFMNDNLMFSNYSYCTVDSSLTGCLAAQTAPCVTTDVTPGNHGIYVDRRGDYWTLTTVSLEPAADSGGIGGASADGTLRASAVREDGATMQLTLTFHTPYQRFVC
jgi:hypothetical protein